MITNCQKNIFDFVLLLCFSLLVGISVDNFYVAFGIFALMFIREILIKLPTKEEAKENV